MDLYKLIPKKQRHNRDWSVGKDYVFFKKLHNVPLCYFKDGIVWVFLDLRIQRQVVDLIHHLENSNLKFYFTHPEFSNPGEEFNINKIPLHCFRCYADSKFYKSIKKIDFDFIENLVSFTKEFSDFETLLLNFKIVQKEVGKKWYDYYNKKDIWDYSEEIREEFRTLWREIQINNIL
jgi:hypothetical protein